MLKYLIQVTEDLLAAGVLVGAIYAFIISTHGVNGRKTLNISAAVGFVIAVVMGILTNTTKVLKNVNTAYILCSALVICFVIFTVLSLIKPLGKIKNSYLFTAVPAGIYICLLFMYKLPTVLAYPFNFDLSNSSVLSTDFLYRLIGWILGLVLVFLAFIGTYKILSAHSVKLTKPVVIIIMLLTALRNAATVLNVMLSRRVISSKSPMYHPLFVYVKNMSNYGSFLVYVILFTAAVAAIILFKQSFTWKEHYDNAAQHRKIKAKWRNRRRWVVMTLIVFVIGVLNISLVKAILNKPVELSPIEDCAKTDDENLYISFEQLSDGHLHRFAYTTEEGVQVRFIIIKKPNSSAYGVGLDACDICGETGYYERDGQVVCKLCDVVMNINTIGFKGGCNPIVIDYSIADGYIIVPVSTLLEHAVEFTR